MIPAAITRMCEEREDEMIMHIYDYRGARLIGKIIAEPECGHDFCDRCGDCLDCYGGDPCWDNDRGNGDHFWVRYLEPGDTVPSSRDMDV
jgi:hypothetical protein